MRVDAPSVLLIYTGGTIGMIENPETGALENFNFDHLLKHVPELKRFNYRISSYQFNPPLDSSDITIMMILMVLSSFMEQIQWPTLPLH